MKWFISLVLACPAFAAVSNASAPAIGSQQAEITAAVANPANCQVVVYTDAARTIKSPDTDETAHPGSTACNRASSLVLGGMFKFVFGTRSQGTLASPSTTYYVTVTDNTDASSASFQFTTQAAHDGLLALPIGLGTGATGDQVRVGYGYYEFGSVSSLYCTSSPTPCYTAWTACASGCTINVPIVPGYTLYYQVQRQSASGMSLTQPIDLAVNPGAAVGLNVTVLGKSNTQAVVSFTANPPTTTIICYSDAGRTLPVNDTNETLFPGSTAVTRAGNVVNGTSIIAVLGTRVTQTAADGKAYSRALPQGTTTYCTAADSSTGQSANFPLPLNVIPWGQGYNDPLPAAPYLSPTSATQTIADPQTGLVLNRLTLASDITSTQVFSAGTPVAGSGWTGNPVSGTATVTASTGTMFVPVSTTAVADARGGGNHGTHSEVSASLNQDVISVTAQCTANCSPTSLQFALSVDGGLNPATNWITVTVTGSPATYTPGTGGSLLSPWISTPLPSFDVTALPKRVGTGTVSGTTLTWTSGPRFPTWMAAGFPLVVNGTNCTGTIVTDQQIMLNACGATSGTWSMQPFGVLIRGDGTSTVNVSALTHTLTYGVAPGWDAAGVPQGNVTCSPVQVSGGNLCFVAPGIYWINHSTGQRNFLGVAKVPFRAGTDGWGSLWCSAVVWDQANGSKGTCFIPSFNNLITMVHSGALIDVGPTDYNTSLTECGSNPCWTFSNAAPPSTSHDLASQFTAFSAATAAFATQYGGVAINYGTTEGTDFEFQVRPLSVGSTNDTIAWTCLFTPSTGLLSACAPADRWSGVHGAGPTGFPGWASIPDTGYRGPVTGADIDGNGPFQTLFGAALGTGATTCPAWNPSSGISVGSWPVGNLCQTITTTGQPCDGSPGANEPTGGCSNTGVTPGYHIYDVAIGDVLCTAPSGSSYRNIGLAWCPDSYQGGELLRVLQIISPTSWVVQRGYWGTQGSIKPFVARSIGDWLFTIPAACNTGASSVFACPGPANVWSYATQPTGPTAVLPNYGCNGHTLQVPGAFVSGASFGNAPTIDGDADWSYCVSPGNTVPSQIAPGVVPTWEPNNVPFAGKLGEGSPLGVESHPGCPQCTANPVSNTYFTDARPWLGDSSLNSCTTVSGTLLHCTSARLRRKYLPTLANVGSISLTDVSGPGAVITGTIADRYKYCVPVITNECIPGSVVGDVYVNIGTSSQTGCTAMPSGGLDADLSSVCAGDNGSTAAGMVQSLLNPSYYGQTSPNGASLRFLTSALSTYFWTDQFWNARGTPDGAFGLFMCPWCTGRSEVFTAAMPSLTATLASNGYQSVPIAAPASAYARLRFGYTPAFQCSSDSDACVTGGTPWSWLREAPAPTPCSTGCTLSLPAIPGRAVYYRIEQTDASGNLLSAGLTQVTIP